MSSCFLQIAFFLRKEGKTWTITHSAICFYRPVLLFVVYVGHENGGMDVHVFTYIP